MKEFKIGANEAGQRFDKFLKKYMKEAPTSFFYKMLRKKNITLNGKKAAGNELLKDGDVVKIFVSDETFEKFSGVQQVKKAHARLDIVYEDQDIVLINKPQGMLSQPDNSGKPSMVEYLTGYLLESGSLTEDMLKTFHPSVVNRLDRNTSGMIACGKSLSGLKELSLMFHDRTIHKYYLALVWGEISKASHIRGYLVKDEKRNKVSISVQKTEGASYIETNYTPLKSKNGVTLLKVELLTGKPHQIRAHLASQGHPIVGDVKYGSDTKNKKLREQYRLGGQLLHAYELVFPEETGQLDPKLSGASFRAELPPMFRKMISEYDLKGYHYE